MGAVYQAWDSELGVAVALKMIRPDVSRDPATARTLERRFKQELLLARQITHKNVVRIHDLGEIDGLKYISMPFIEGSDLATILEQKGKLPVTSALQLARQIAAGLQAAHEAGIVHRDLKPANIMVEHDHALITDFGIARSEAQPVPAGAGAAQSGVLGTAGSLSDDSTYAATTMAGAVVGTIDYMAPEQVKADPVDHRADVYAFGLIVYDMLLGLRRARRKESAVEELTQRLTEAPPSPRSIDPAIPEPLDRVVTRCLQPDPAARYQTTAELVGALDRLDEKGKLLPLVRRLTPRLMATTALLVIVALAATYFVAQRLVRPPVQHDPVSVVIADFENRTGDPAFDRTLEPTFKLALEGAGFVSAYDRSGITRSLGVNPPEKFDERAAVELAVKQGMNVVLSGYVGRQGARYAVSARAIQVVTGNLITTETERTSDRSGVLRLVTSVATSVREALGDETTSDSARRFAMETLSATSLEAVREYARGMDAMSSDRSEAALQYFSRAVAIDPNFGTAYGAMAATSRNLDHEQDAVKYAEEALRHLDGMTDRERYRARGYYYFLINDYQPCVKEYGDLVARYPADAGARNNLALCWSKLRDMPKAMDEMQQAVKILPNQVIFRENLALYAAYSGDFETAERQVQAMKELGLFGLLPRAFAQLLQGAVLQAAGTYEALGKVDEQGASYTISGLADLAVYEGRYAEAAEALKKGAESDIAARHPERAGNKLTALAYAQLQRQQKKAAVAAAEKALAQSQALKIRFLAARVFVEAGAAAQAGAIAAALRGELQAEPQAHGLIIEGMAALQGGDARRAIAVLTEANGVLDTWIGHFDLGRAYLAAGAFPQADSEFERCLKRRGEALALFLDEEPTYGYFPPVYYYQGRVREGLKSTKAGESYQAYLDIRGRSTEDPLLPEVRRRLSGELR
jgi:eukaryotic-like serine/threonine-protein kinase